MQQFLGIQNDTATLENHFIASYKVKQMFTMKSQNPLLHIYPKERKAYLQAKTYSQLSLITQNSSILH